MPRENLKKQFGEIRSLRKLVELVHGYDLMHKAYQYYTTVTTLEKILDNQMIRLSRCSSARLNDTRERNKYGVDSVLDRTYIFCMSYGYAEQASMWSMYGDQSAESVRIVLNGSSIAQWRNEFRNLKKKSYTANGKGASKRLIEKVDINDLIYASVRTDDQDDSMRPSNGRSVFCNDMYGYITDVRDGMRAKDISGWVKDYEWRCENETRMCVRLAKKYAGEYVYLKLPPYVIKSMEFTMSPWLPKAYEESFCARLKEVWPKGEEFGSFDESRVGRSPRVGRSSLFGALNFK